MERQLATTAYWLGIVSTVIALITRGLAMLGIFAVSTTFGGKGNPITYRTFLEGAVLFFVMGIASSVAVWAKERKA
jgi:hypothetical protein